MTKTRRQGTAEETEIILLRLGSLFGQLRDFLSRVGIVEDSQSFAYRGDLAITISVGPRAVGDARTFIETISEIRNTRNRMEWGV